MSLTSILSRLATQLEVDPQCQRSNGPLPDWCHCSSRSRQYSDNSRRHKTETLSQFALARAKAVAVMKSRGEDVEEAEIDLREGGMEMSVDPPFYSETRADDVDAVISTRITLLSSPPTPPVSHRRLRRHRNTSARRKRRNHSSSPFFSDLPPTPSPDPSPSSSSSSSPLPSPPQSSTSSVNSSCKVEVRNDESKKFERA